MLHLNYLTDAAGNQVAVQIAMVITYLIESTHVEAFKSVLSPF